MAPVISPVPDRIYLFYTRAEDARDSLLLDRCRSVLSPEEIRRLEQYKNPGARHLSLLARALVRYLLGEFTGLAPQALSFTANGHGKPALVPGQGADIHFNLSHTRGGVVCGICLNHEIGVDLEDLNRKVDPRVAQRFFAPDEAEQVSRCPGQGQKALFLRIWTLKEAYIKARGKGLSLPLDRFAFDLRGDRIRFQTLGPDLDPSGAPDNWQFFRWDPEPGKVVAAALAAPLPVDIKTFYCRPFGRIRPAILA